MKRHIAYYRVSTDRQGRSGLGLDAQRAAVAAYVAGQGELAAEFTEVESGKRHDNRPQLAAALVACRKQKAILVIARLDRLARNVHFISGLMESKVEFVAVDIPDANRFTLHMMAAFAEHEREMISQRTKDALAVVKARGTKLGNPRPAAAAALAAAAVSRKADIFAGPLRPMLETMRQQGKTLQAIADELNTRGIKTARGNMWQPQTVKNVLARST